MSDISQQMNNLSVQENGSDGQYQPKQNGRRQYVPPHLRNRSGQQSNSSDEVPFGGSRRNGYDNRGGFSSRGNGFDLVAPEVELEEDLDLEVVDTKDKSQV